MLILPCEAGEGDRPKGGGGGARQMRKLSFLRSSACPHHHASHGPPPPQRGGGCKRRDAANVGSSESDGFGWWARTNPAAVHRCRPARV